MLEPFRGPYPGAEYKVYSGVSSGNLAALSAEIANKIPVYAARIKHTTAPAMSGIVSKFSTPLADGAFAATISGYFVPPLTGQYNLSIGGHFMAMLSFSIETRSIESAINNQTSFDGDTKV